VKGTNEQHSFVTDDSWKCVASG